MRRRPANGSTVDAAGIPWSALTWGDPAARPLLLIHGVTSSAAAWWRLGPAFAASGRRVVAVDLPGHGRTGSLAGPPSVPRQRRRCRGLRPGRRPGHARPPGGRPQLGRHDRRRPAGRRAATGHPRPARSAGRAPRRHLGDGRRPERADLSRAAPRPSEAVRRENPAWSDGDVAAKAEALTQLDEAAARSVLLDNGDWDGGLADLADPAAAGHPGLGRARRARRRRPDARRGAARLRGAHRVRAASTPSRAARTRRSGSTRSRPRPPSWPPWRPTRTEPGRSAGRGPSRPASRSAARSPAGTRPRSAAPRPSPSRSRRPCPVPATRSRPRHRPGSARPPPGRRPTAGPRVSGARRRSRCRPLAGASRR